MRTPELETERLLLREVRREDINDIFECWMKDENVSRYMCWKASDDIKDAEEFVEFELGNIENNQWNRWMIILKETGKLIGTGLIYFNEDEQNWDISYNFGKCYWGQGYATEAMKKIMEYATETLGVKECIAAHAVENPNSGKVIQKLGFQYIKEIPYECNGGNIITTGKYYKYQYQKCDCVFCHRDWISTDFVYEDDKVMAFLDMAPINEGHVLLVPKQHYLDADEMPDELLEYLSIMSKKIVHAIKEVYQPDGYSIMQNGGAFNDIGHYHLHIFPRYHGDGFGWTSGSEEKSTRKEIAESIKSKLTGEKYDRSRIME